jgi:outer membrane protein TolC
MRFRQIVLGAAVLAVLSVPARGDSAPQEYDLPACIRASLANDPDLQAAAADVALARARLAEAESARWGQSEYNQVLSFVPEAKGDILDPPQENRNAIFRNLGPFTQIDLSINIPLWTFGKLAAALEAAQKGLEAQQLGGEVKRAEVVLQVKRLYYGLQLAEQLAAVLRDMLNNMDTAVKKAQERLDRGSSAVTEIDVLKLRTGRARFAKGVAEVEGSAALARSALARAIGLDVTAPFQIADRRLQPVEVTIESLEQYLAEGPDRRPEGRQIESGVAAQAAKVDLEEAGLYPSIFLATGFQYAVAPNRTRQRNPFAFESFNYERPIGALGIHWDLNFFQNNAKVEQARADLERLRAQQRSAVSGLRLEIQKAYLDVAQARNTIQATDDGRRAGRALLVLSVSNFDLAIGEAEELFKGLGAYTEASTDYFRAVHDFNVAVGALSRAVGRELTGLEY